MKTRRINSENALFSAMFLMALCLFALRFLLALSYLPETGGVSINVLYGITRIINGSYLYTDPELPPFPIIQYMPLHFYSIKAIASILGLQNDIHGLMVLNRLFCLLIDCLCVFIISRSLNKHFKLNLIFSVTLALIYFVSIPGIIYSRGDNLYLLFFITTVILLHENFSESTVKSWTSKYLPHLTGLTSALAINTKQTGLFLIVLCFIYFLFHKNLIVNLVKYGISFLSVTLVIFLLTEPAASISAFKLNVIDGVKNGININWFLEVFLKNYFLKFSYLLAGGILIAILLLKNNSEKINRFAGFGICWYFSVAVLSSFKAGSGPNYYLEFLVLSIFGLALLVRNNNFEYRQQLLFVLVLTPFFMIASANDKGWGDIKQMKRAEKDYRNCILVANYVLPKVKENEWVLTNFHKESTINLHLSDKALFPCREVALYFTRPIGVFHFNEFSRMINTKRIPFIIDHRNELLPVFLDDTIKSYSLDTTIGKYAIYRLNSR